MAGKQRCSHALIASMLAGWMAPEVIRNEVSGSPADVYSYSIVVWELLCRQVRHAKLVHDTIALCMHACRHPGLVWRQHRSCLLWQLSISALPFLRLALTICADSSSAVGTW
jgi:hypothetical protein